MHWYEKLRTKTSAVVAVVILIGAIITMAQPGSAYASSVTSSTIGVVDYQLLINQHPDTQKANVAFQAAVDQAKKDYADKSVNMSDQDKKALDQQLAKQVDQVRQDLLKAIQDKVNAAVKQVADADGLTVVVSKNVVVYGGMDITADVMKIITGK